MQILSVDHFVLTVRDIQTTLAFYSGILGMREEMFSSGGFSRYALKFGGQKINLHEQGNEYLPGARFPLPGTGDFCLITDTPITEVISWLREKNVVVEEGPVIRTGATSKLESVYVRDPDQNLVEIANVLN